MMVNFPDQVWGRLAAEADKRGVKLADLIVDAAHHVLDGPKTPLAPTHAPRGQSKRAALNTNDPEVVAVIKDLHSLGWSMPMIAARMNVSYDSVRSAFQRLQLAPTSSHGKRIPVDETHPRRLNADGASDVDIAAALGVSRKKVRAVRREIGIPTASRPGRKPNHPRESNAA